MRGLSSREPPSDVLLPTDEFIRDIGESWKVFRNLAGRTFYYDTRAKRSSWKPPRNLKPKSNIGDITAPAVVSMVRDSIREIEDPELRGNISPEELRVFDISLPSPPVPPGYVEYFTKRTGNIYYEDLASGQKWYTALDTESRLYFYTEVTETGEYRSEWSLPPLSSPLASEVHHMWLPQPGCYQVVVLL